MGKDIERRINAVQNPISNTTMPEVFLGVASPEGESTQGVSQVQVKAMGRGETCERLITKKIES